MFKLRPGLAVHSDEMRNAHASAGNSDSLDATAARQERVAASLSREASEAMALDPDLLVYDVAGQDGERPWGWR